MVPWQGKTLDSHGEHRISSLTPYSNYSRCSGYHVDPLLKKEVFTLETDQFSQKMPEQVGYLEQGVVSLILHLVKTPENNKHISSSDRFPLNQQGTMPSILKRMDVIGHLFSVLFP